MSAKFQNTYPRPSESGRPGNSAIAKRPELRFNRKSDIIQLKVKIVVGSNQGRKKRGLVHIRSREIDFGHGNKGGDERVNLGRMNGSHHPFGVQIPGSGVMAPDLAGSDRGNRRKMFAKSAGIVNFNPQEPVVTPHSKLAVKGKIARSSNYQTRRNQNSINGCPGGVSIVGSWR